jgi:hypothetical protein
LISFELQVIYQLHENIHHILSLVKLSSEPMGPLSEQIFSQNIVQKALDDYLLDLPMYLVHLLPQ